MASMKGENEYSFTERLNMCVCALGLSGECVCFQGRFDICDLNE